MKLQTDTIHFNPPILHKNQEKYFRIQISHPSDPDDFDMSCSNASMNAADVSPLFQEGHKVDEAPDDDTDDDGEVWSFDEVLWAYIWGGAYVLSEILLASSETLKGKNVLELGCGLGLSGISCSLAGANTVTCTDVSSAAISLVKSNADLNHIKKGIKAMVMDWSKSIYDYFPVGHSGFDVIIASEILYLSSHYSEIARVFKLKLKSDGIGIIVGTPRESSLEFDNICKSIGLVIERHVLFDLDIYADTLKTNIGEGEIPASSSIRTNNHRSLKQTVVYILQHVKVWKDEIESDNVRCVNKHHRLTSSSNEAPISSILSSATSTDGGEERKRNIKDDFLEAIDILRKTRIMKEGNGAKCDPRSVTLYS